MSFLSGIYTRFAAALGQPAEADNEGRVNQSQSQSPGSETLDAPSHSSRTLSPDEEGKEEEEQQQQQEGTAAQDIPILSRAPPTPFFAAPATPFAGHPSPVLHEAAAQQLQREIMGVAPRTPAPFNLSQATPMTRYHTPALPNPTPAIPSTVQTSKRESDTFQTPMASPSKRQRVQQIEEQEDSHILLGDLELDLESYTESHTESYTEDMQEESEASTSPDANDMESPSSSEAEDEDMDTSSTSVSSSSLSDHAAALAVPSHNSRKQNRRPRAVQSKSYCGRARARKASRPLMSRNISGREELLNKARRRFWDRRADGERLF